VNNEWEILWKEAAVAIFNCGIPLCLIINIQLQQLFSVGTPVKSCVPLSRYFPSINNHPEVPVGLFEVCPGTFLIVTAHFFPAIRQPVCHTVLLIATVCRTVPLIAT
jgi:hypothetical protein